LAGKEVREVAGADRQRGAESHGAGHLRGRKPIAEFGVSGHYLQQIGRFLHNIGMRTKIRRRVHPAAVRVKVYDSPNSSRYGDHAIVFEVPIDGYKGRTARVILMSIRL